MQLSGSRPLFFPRRQQLAICYSSAWPLANWLLVERVLLKHQTSACQLALLTYIRQQPHFPKGQFFSLLLPSDRIKTCRNKPSYN